MAISFMKKVLFVCLLLWPLYAISQTGVLTIKKESLRSNNYLTDNWLYKPGDDTAWAAKGLDGKTWSPVAPFFITGYKSHKKLPFDGIGWFRLHFRIDSSGLGNKTIGLKMNHWGASEVYLDGKRIQRFGTVKGKDSSWQFNPQDVPFSLPGITYGEHILAI